MAEENEVDALAMEFDEMDLEDMEAQATALDMQANAGFRT